MNGRLDLWIKSKDYLVIVELKNIKIRYLDLGDGAPSKKARTLTKMSLDKILELKISKFDRYNSGKSIRKYVDEKVGPQLNGYVLGNTVKMESVKRKVRAFAVVIIGNRKVLVREMNDNGQWRKDGNNPGQFSDGFYLAQLEEKKA